MKSTSGLSIWPRNCLAYADSDSTYRRWPSAKIVSKARLDLPDPDRPVKTIMESRGRSSETSLRLCSRAPRTTSRSATALSALPADVGQSGTRDAKPCYPGGQTISGRPGCPGCGSRAARPVGATTNTGRLLPGDPLVAAGRPVAGLRAARQAVHIAGVREAQRLVVGAQPLVVAVAVQPEPTPAAIV